MLDSELVELLGPGCGIVVATVGPDGEPRATRGWVVRVTDPATRRIRLVVTADDPVSVSNLAVGRIAVTGADVRTLRSAQLKGSVVAVEPPTADDLAELTADSERFFAEIHDTDGTPIELQRRLLPHEVLAVEIAVDELYDQSPGPVAGSAVGATP